MKILIACLLLIISCVTSARERDAHEVKLFFDVPIETVVQYTLAHMRLSSRYQKYPKDYDERLAFDHVHVASVITKDGNRFVFVGIPYKKPIEGTYVAYLQYCSYSEEYVFSGSGMASDSVEVLFQKAVAANGGALGTPDACAIQDSAR